MTSKDLNDLFRRLEQAVRDSDNLDDKGRQRLRDLEQEIRSALEQPTGGARLKSASLNLKAAIEEFEISHSMLTEILGDALTILNNAGI